MKRLASLATGLLLLGASTGAAPAMDGDAYYGSLYDRETGSLDLVLHRGTTYTYSGTCDVDCSDLDFVISEWVPPYNGRRGYWRFVASDRGADDTPYVWVRPSFDTTFRLSIIMSRCRIEPCRYDVNVNW